MGRRSRRVVLGLVALLAALGAGASQARGATDADDRTSIARGDVAASGELTGADGWRVSYVDTGRYRILAPTVEVDLDVPEWVASADVTIVPLGGGATEVRFARNGIPLDTDFGFVALLHH